METIGNYRIVEDLNIDHPGTRFRAEHIDSGDAVVLRLVDSSHLVGRVPMSTRDGVSEEKPDTSPFLLLYSETLEHHNHTVLVRPFVVGRPIDELVQEHLPNLKDAFIIIRDVARGLNVLYSHGLYHGRIHGRNIIVGEKHRAVLVDVDWTQPPASEETTTDDPDSNIPPRDRIVGDFRGLGMVLYQLCTGQTSAVMGDTTELSLAGLSSVSKLLIERLVSDEEDDRFNSADELLATLDGAIAEGTGEENPCGHKQTWTPRQYISMAILMALLIILWFVLSTTYFK